MKLLILIRHAKSSHESGLRDIERPLSESGFFDAALVAGAAADIFDKESVIYISTARRTRDTAAIFAKRFPEMFSTADYSADLYTFNVSELEAFIKNIDDSHDRVIVFGHNEAITDFVNKFGDILIDNVPTCGLVPITFDTDSWKSIRRGTTGRCIFPKDLRT